MAEAPFSGRRLSDIGGSDSLTRTHERNLRVVSAKRLGGRAAEKKDTLAAKAHEKVIFENKLDLTEQDYGRAHRWTLRQLEILEDLPCHVVVIAHSRLTRSGSSTKVTPTLGRRRSMTVSTCTVAFPR